MKRQAAMQSACFFLFESLISLSNLIDLFSNLHAELLRGEDYLVLVRCINSGFLSMVLILSTLLSMESMSRLMYL